MAYILICLIVYMSQLLNVFSKILMDFPLTVSFAHVHKPMVPICLMPVPARASGLNRFG